MATFQITFFNGKNERIGSETIPDVLSREEQRERATALARAKYPQATKVTGLYDGWSGSYSFVERM